MPEENIVGYHFHGGVNSGPIECIGNEYELTSSNNDSWKKKYGKKVNISIDIENIEEGTCVKICINGSPHYYKVEGKLKKYDKLDCIKILKQDGSIYKFQKKKNQENLK